MNQLCFSDIKPVFESLFHDIRPHIIDQFVDYHRANPRIYELFKAYATQIRNKGIRHYGAKAIMERIRWHVEIDMKSGDFKINNNFASCYARLLISEDASFKAFFETRHTPAHVAI